ncbi:odorant receptor Or2-like [Pseudomyrmex gracilis]|uniref:odorant receptor Or2-like n=1 Tax=Pseudomyrmex gracilis TaxID=219809 RepID=UPI000995CEC9|nr:odorant receptor Or2-like [Pseudomyrmex gracilis]
MFQVDFEWATKLNRLMLSVPGIWPNVHGDARDRFLSDLRATSSLLLFVFIGLIPAIHSLMIIWGDMIAIIDNLQFTLPLMMIIMKLVTIWSKKMDLGVLLDMIADDWLKVKTHRELQVMTKRARDARVLTVFGYVFVFLGFVLIAFPPCFGTSLRYVTNVTDPIRILPLQTHYFYDKDRSPYFELTFTAQALLLLTASASYVGVDNLLGLLVFHLCGQMENLKERLINMRQFETFNSGLAFIVEDHIRLIKYFNIVENTFTLLLLGLLLYFGAIFCLYGFLFVAILTEGKQMSVMQLVYLIPVGLNVCGHMCLHCVVGEILVAQCESIYRAVYNCEWYTLEPEEARTLILLMIRTNKPLYITAGKMFPMTMSTFCNLIKTSGGYISVLLAKQDY